MSTPIFMPQLGESVVEGTVEKWLIAEGQPVREGEPLLRITTDKIDTDIPAPASGVLLAIHVEEGQTVARGTVLAEIATVDERPPTADRSLLSGEPAEPHVDTGRPSAVGRPPSVVGGPSSAVGGQPSATPLALRLAAEHGIDLSAITGTDPAGRITREDVEAFVSASPSSSSIVHGPSSAVRRPSSNLGFISPAVSRLAVELDADLTQVIGTGANGRITKKDVLAYVATPVPREPTPIPVSGVPVAEEVGLPILARSETGQSKVMEEAAPLTLVEPGEAAVRPAVDRDIEVIPLSAMRRTIGQHMRLSLQTAPQVTTVMEADMTRMVLARERLRVEFERQGARLTFTPFFIQAIVAGVQAVPEANSTIEDDALLVHKRIHIGVAVALPNGLIVPVIRDANEKSLLGLARAVNDLAERARRGRLAPDDVQGGTFTLTNHGTSGSLFATPILVQAQVGILGVGVIHKRPVVISRGHALLPDAEDAIAIRPIAFLSFTFDHRVLDGQGADRFLGAVAQFLENYSG